jgi:hypothetical protein
MTHKNWLKNANQTIADNTLKITCESATCFSTALHDIEAIIAVDVVPIFAPMMMAIHSGSVINQASRAVSVSTFIHELV